jgi:methylase of polypeptide subunit release factors
MRETPIVTWSESGENRSARWRSESGMPPPRRVVIADDRTTAETAYKLACEGTAMLWRGDFQNARQLLQAMARRFDKGPRHARKPSASSAAASAPAGLAATAFHLHRRMQSQRARTLAMLLLPFAADHRIPLRRAPDVQEACLEAYGPGDMQYLASLRELLGLIGAHEWRKKGVEVTALAARIHPHYGVFAPIRSEYVGLVAAEPFPVPAPALAFDIGTGTGVLAAVLARRGISHIVATDQDPRALVCATENIERLGLADIVGVVPADLYPPGRAALVVCNPPWLPARPSSPIEQAIYDPDSRMLRGFLDGLAAHLAPGGVGWLLLSDLAERLGLRSRGDLLAAIADAGLSVIGRSDVRPDHPRTADAADPFYAARSAEITSLWRLAANSAGLPTG